MEGIEFNPGNPAAYNDYVPEVEKKRFIIILCSAAVLLAGLGIYKLYKSYTRMPKRSQVETVSIF